MSTFSTAALLLEVLCLLALVCCVALALRQFNKTPSESAEHQLSMRFMSGSMLMASTIAWGAAAWNISELSAPNNDITLIEQLPNPAAGISIPPFSTVYEKNSPSQTYFPDESIIPPFPSAFATPEDNKRFHVTEDYTRARKWLSRKLFESTSFHTEPFQSRILKLDNWPFGEAMRHLIKQQPELFAIIFYPENSQLRSDKPLEAGNQPIVFYPDTLSEGIVYTPYRGEVASILAKLIKSNILFSKTVFNTSKPQS